MNTQLDEVVLFIHTPNQDMMTPGETVKSMQTVWNQEDVIGLLYGVDYCRFVRLKADGSFGFPGNTVSLGNVFEARMFNASGELRWLRDPEGTGKGRAVFLSERDVSPKEWTKTKLTGLTYREDDYLLWGTTTTWKKDAGWLQLATPRIGGLYVPVPTGVPQEEKQRLWLHRREYLGTAPGMAGIDHGNQAVVEERLVGILNNSVVKEKSHANTQGGWG